MRYCDKSKPYIYISYEHKDFSKVEEIVNRLKAEGFNILFDERIESETEWDDNIAMNISNCAYFIAFVSEGYVDSKNCREELYHSIDLNINQLVVYLENADVPRGMAMRMNRIQAVYWYNYGKDNVEEAYEKLFNANGIDVTKESLLDKIYTDNQKS